MRGVVDHQARRADREIAPTDTLAAPRIVPLARTEGRVLVAFEAAIERHVEDTAAGEGHRAQGQLTRAGGLQDHAVVLNLLHRGCRRP